jgi:hypothetical protein
MYGGLLRGRNKLLASCIRRLSHPQYCPEPKNDEEKELQKEEDEKYIRGRIQYAPNFSIVFDQSLTVNRFIQEDPGRQSISGSFNPIDDGEWTEQAYIGEAEKLCKAIISFDRVTVLRMIKEEVDVNRRDHVGRAPLHLAILTGASEIACDLIDAGARMMARLVDGRTALHLAAQLGLGRVVEKLLERSKLNKEKAEEEEAAKETEEGKTAADEDDPMDGTSRIKEDAKSEDIGDDERMRTRATVPTTTKSSTEKRRMKVPAPTQTFPRMMKTSQTFSTSTFRIGTRIHSPWLRYRQWSPGRRRSTPCCRIRSSPASQIQLPRHPHRPPSFPDGSH